MNPSPARTLLSRRVCRCTSSKLPVSSPHLTRLLSSSTQHNEPTSPQSSFTSPIPTYGSSEMLRRKYQKTKQETGDVRKDKAEQARTVKRMRWAGYGIAACTLAIFATVSLYPDPRKESQAVVSKTEEKLPSNVVRLDAPAPPSITGSIVDPSSKPQDVEQIPTGTSSIPFFPRIIHIASDAPPSTPASANEGSQSDVEYQLVGLGIRTVSILSIQVYVVGLYVAVADIAALQQRLVQAAVPPSESVATTLVPSEKSQLKELLLDPDRGEQIWNDIVKDGQLRTAFRIVPTRNTDFMHLRDGFVRGITARSAHFASDRHDDSFQDESFGVALNEFKSAFGGSARRKLPKGDILLLVRDAQGKMTVWNEDSKRGDRLQMGVVTDERVGRLLWLNYLAGKNVSSEDARRNVVEGCMEFVERPVGTVATQVV
ncbi:uncharacterized protein Z520_03872 [Fonsecaea multimorphosa CBS 102226]|uniref:Chalcone isomerase domain-containing protein n=1 Tax=Fonsecaea multimorphosa CBS 102226 TaxID=1442371 RepID=A0A0D2ITA4_9EURO|nr:uncharacterized protein Z520_03872 [Fonsecaea multimorphosa CBS 102226]KIY00187.1 hypothetical protein Z520_03872 [Fonsecaea multimorphosa CBS 102226]OAL27382.1 hypothetical protein AYO22_03657 [Fonsecaea multimorphosa]